MMGIKFFLLLTLFYMSKTTPDFRATSATPATSEGGIHKKQNQNPDLNLENDLGNSANDFNQQHSQDFPDFSLGSPATMERKATRGKRKVHRAVGWIIGTGLTLAGILVLIAGMALTSRGTNTTEEEEQTAKGCCCNMLGWLTKTSSQLPLWKSLLLKTAVTILSTIAAALFSLVITNLLAEREESVEDTVRDILGLPAEDEDGHSQGRRRREVDQLMHAYSSRRDICRFYSYIFNKYRLLFLQI